MTRRRGNFLSGTLSAPITSGATSISSVNFAALPEIVSPDTMDITLDVAASAGAPEIVTIGAHAAGSTTVTSVARGAYGTAARSHAAGVGWVNPIITADVGDEIHLGAIATMDGVTDDTAALVAAVAKVGDGGTLVVDDGTCLYSSIVDIPAHIRIEGNSRASSILKGPGLRCLLTVNESNDADIHLEDLTLDGSDYTSSGRGVDVLAGGHVTTTRVKYIGFKYQAVIDQCQRYIEEACEYVAAAATKAGLWIPYGPDAHAGVDASLFTTNIVKVGGSHYNFHAATAGYPIADDGGLQHEYDSVQCSYGVASMRIGRPEGVSLSNSDMEFATGTDTILSASTSLIGTALGAKAGTVEIGAGNFFDKQVNLTNIDTLVDIGNEFHIASLPVYRNCSSANCIALFGSANVSSGGTLVDADPSGRFYYFPRGATPQINGDLVVKGNQVAFTFRGNAQGATQPQFKTGTSMSVPINVGANYGFGQDDNAKQFINAKPAEGWYDLLNGVASIVHNDGAGGMVLPERTGGDPAAPAANHGYVYMRDNGSGKTQLVALFPSGAVQVIATEP